ncbi:CFF_collapsed_G0005600.mRNA.1.CDS.1 [Saccharomyces cerevisiae]|nr:CFF_collapsed_G0005600.mRNA.1.CDS.1 [Saccharomyces cerevisiae]
MKKILKYAEKEQNKPVLKNQEKLVIAHCSSSTKYIQGINEVVRNPEYSKIVQNTKNLKETHIMDEFLEHLNKDDNKAWYGAEETERAAKLDAIETLLITDSVLKRNDVKKREKYLDLIENSRTKQWQNIRTQYFAKITVNNLTNQQI